MEVFFNEVSLSRPFQDFRKAQQAMHVFVLACQKLWHAGARVLRVPPEFQVLQIFGDYTVLKWLHDDSTRIDRELRRLIAIMGKHDYMEASADCPKGNPRIKWEDGSESLAVGLGFAEMNSSIAISILSHKIFNQSSISLVSDGTDRTASETITVRNVCWRGHLTHHLELISLIQFRLTPWILTTNNPLPRVDLSDLLVGGRWHSFYKRALREPAGKVASYDQMGTRVAICNGYQESTSLSQKNSLRHGSRRKIFVSPLDCGVILSIDFEKGAFEVLDSNGKHCGELLFSGTWNALADRTGRHDIILLFI